MNDLEYDDNNLKNCPFCGCEARLHQNYNDYSEVYFVFAKCDMCGAEGKKYSSNTNAARCNWENESCYLAAAAWNNRPYSMEDMPDLISLITRTVLKLTGKNKDRFN